MKSTFYQLYLAIFLLVPAPLFSQNNLNVMDAIRLVGPVNLDGQVDEAAWDAVPPTVLQQQVPNYGLPPTERSEVYFAYDENYLYLAGRMYLSDSSLYRATTYKRDALEGSTDYFGFVVDSYNDNENGLAFFTTPAGLRWDGTVSNDAQDFETSISIDWNTYWDAAAARQPWGWSAEIRIPWSSLRFQERNGEAVMGSTMWWFLAAKNEQVMHPLVPLNWGEMGAWKPSQMQKYRFQGLRSRKPLYLTPYILGGFQQTSKLTADHKGYRTENEPKIEAGLDLKYSLTSNLTLDLTANTDFAQVEVDDQQVNLTRFDLFLPEKRQFFLERASIFDFQFEGNNRLFYSRRIGITDEDQVRIYGGARIQGRIEKHDLGFLTMQTAAPSDSLQSENFSVLRVRRQAFNQYSYLGAIATHRTDFNGNHNTTYGFDATVRVVGDEYLAAKWAQSFENGQENQAFSLDPSRIFLNWQRRRYDGIAYDLGFTRAGKDWSPGMGFEERETFDGGKIGLSYGWLMDEKAKLLNFRIFLAAYALRNFVSGKTETAAIETGFEMKSKTGWQLAAFLSPTSEYVLEDFDLGDSEVPVGSYDFVQGTAVFGTPDANKIGVFTEIKAGGFYDGTLLSASLMPRWIVSSHLRLEGTYQYNRADFDERGQHYIAQIGKFKVEYLFNTKLSLAAFLQYNSDEQVFVENMRLRYNPREGNDLYIVFNDLVNSDRKRETPHLPFSDDRAVVVKYTYTFRM
ncbi:MAG: carbohydrate binding family 9 domain-containing protein [Saprospiraceae bacterium]|nr:carbohydrate binding family 9 domain-containing protein [Saprospiraceae bacterium]